MRDIKFRGWDGEKMHFDLLVYLGAGFVEYNTLNPNHIRIEEKINIQALEQYTGLTDKNGVEIYEGDILDNGRVKFIAAWDESGFWTASVIDDKKWVDERELLVTYGSSYEVIGNIHNGDKS